MENSSANLVKTFESGQVSRREFCENRGARGHRLRGGRSRQAQDDLCFKTIGVNHISYTCRTMPRRATSTTSRVRPHESPGKDNGTREPGIRPEAGKGRLLYRRAHGGHARQSAPAVTGRHRHICFTMSNWKEADVRAELAART